MLYIDIDGVLANTDKYIYSLYPEAKNDTHMLFKTIYNNYKTMFLDSEPLIDLSILKSFDNYTLLTALPLRQKIESFCSKNNEADSILETLANNKKQWVTKYIGKDTKLIIVGKRADKIKLCKSSNDILVDDSTSTCKSWRQAGGKAFCSIDSYISSRDNIINVSEITKEELW